MSEYKYKVGELVFFRREVEGFEFYAPLVPQKSWPDHSLRLPYPIPVMHRHLDECHGGIQDFYTLSLIDRNLRVSPVDLVAFHEGSDRILSVFKNLRELEKTT